MNFLWVTVVEEKDEGKTEARRRVLINLDQICSLHIRTITLSDCSEYLLSVLSAEEIIAKVGVRQTPPPMPPLGPAPPLIPGAYEGRIDRGEEQ